LPLARPLFLAALLLAIGLLAPTPASATVLCEELPVEVGEGEGAFLGCPSWALYGTDLSAGDTISGKLTADSPQGEGLNPAAVFESVVGKVSCASSEFKAGLKSSGSPLAEGTITSLTYGSCTTTISSCTVTSFSTATPLTAYAEYDGIGSSGPNGEITVKNPKTTLKFSCFGGLFKPTCIYDGGSEGSPILETGDYYDAENENAPTFETGGILDFSDMYVLTAAEGSGSENCPKEGMMRATYATSGAASATTEVNVAQQPMATKLCKEEPVDVEGKYLECKNGGYKGVVQIDPESLYGLYFAVINPHEPPENFSCSTFISGEFNENGSSAKGITEFKLKGVTNDKCVGELNGKGAEYFPAKMLNLPYNASSFVYTKRLDPVGELIFAGSNGKPMLEVEVTTKKCLYRVGGSNNRVYNGTKKVNMDMTWYREGTEALCPLGLAMTGSLPLKAVGANTPLWLAEK